MKNCWCLAFTFSFIAVCLSTCANQPADVMASSQTATTSATQESVPVDPLPEDSVSQASDLQEPVTQVPASEELVPMAPESIVETALIHELGMALTLKVSSSHEYENWLLLSGSPQDPATGGPLDYTGTPYESRRNNGAFDDIFTALLQRNEQSHVYHLRELSFGSTDTPVPEWQSRYRLPPKLVEPFAVDEQFLQW